MSPEMDHRPVESRRHSRRKLESSFFYERVIPILLAGLGVMLLLVILLALRTP